MKENAPYMIEKFPSNIFYRINIKSRDKVVFQLAVSITIKKIIGFISIM